MPNCGSSAFAKNSRYPKARFLATKKVKRKPGDCWILIALGWKYSSGPFALKWQMKSNAAIGSFKS
jgi:hypothetical protein